MKCPKCKRPMTQLFSSWICDHCSPPDGVKKEKPAAPQEEQTEDDCIFPPDDQWNGWEYADDRQKPIGIAISEPDEHGCIKMILMSDASAYILLNDIQLGRFKKGEIAGQFMALDKNGCIVPYKQRKEDEMSEVSE